MANDKKCKISHSSSVKIPETQFNNYKRYSTLRTDEPVEHQPEKNYTYTQKHLTVSIIHSQFHQLW